MIYILHCIFTFSSARCLTQVAELTKSVDEACANYGEASTRFNLILQQNPADTEVAFNMGQISAKLGDLMKEHGNKELALQHYHKGP